MQGEFLDAEPDAPLVSGGIELIDMTGKLVGTDYPPLGDADIQKVLWYGSPFYTTRGGAAEPI